MDQQLKYADILTRLMRDEEQYQPINGPRIVSVCDPDKGQFLLVAAGWQTGRHIDNILFHAQLADGMVVIESDKTEEGLKPLLIEAGIRAEDFLSSKDYDQYQAVQIAA
jgi:hypothetical protein